MSYIRSFCNPEGLYVFEERGQICFSFPADKPASFKFKAAKVYGESRTDHLVYEYISLDEMKSACIEWFKHNQVKLKNIKITENEDGKLVLKINKSTINVYLVTWDYIARQFIEQHCEGKRK